MYQEVGKKEFGKLASASGTEQKNGTRGGTRDPLTGLCAQEYFYQQLNSFLAASGQRELTAYLALLQLANFYQIRTWLGKSDADLLLNEVARLLEQLVPRGTLICRCHNHEFALLLVNESSRRHRQITQQIQHAILNLSSESVPPQIKMQCSIGLVLLDANAPHARVAFARARHNIARDQWQQLDEQPGPASSSQSDVEILPKLQSALKKSAWRLTYQAIINFETDDLLRYEVRARLQDGHSIISASSYLDTLNRNALGEQLDRQVLETLAQLIEGNPGNPYHFTLNITLNSLTGNSFLSWLQAFLQRHPAVVGKLALQLSEMDLLIAQHHVERFSHCVRDMGLQLSINHFGCSERSQDCLQLAGCQFVKLYRTLPPKTAMTDSAQTYMKRHIDAAHGKNAQVIVPLVETVRELADLWSLRVNLIQGFGLHRPANRPDFEFPQQQELSVM
jgi:diguanylate cyclase (GGDEF)-like protein